MNPIPAEDARLPDDRERYWRSKLRRLRFGAEPLDVQLDRARRVTMVLTGVSVGVALMISMIFAAFGRLDVGLIFVAILFVPILFLAWLDYGNLKSRVHEYEAECAVAGVPVNVAGREA